MINRRRFIKQSDIQSAMAILPTATIDLEIEEENDYYPFGMPMPGRNMVGDYRYAFQGQEKDAETGKEAFELRLWDSRIGRWLGPDPYGEFSSPYLGMGNNPISLTDPDGGMTQGCCPDPIQLDGFTGTQYTTKPLWTRSP